MTSFESNFSPATVIDEILALIHEDYIDEHIIEPIDNAVCTFEYEDEPAATFSSFMKVVCCFIQHIYANGFKIKQVLTTKQAAEIAITILRQYYSGTSEYGIDTAFVIARNTDSSGISFVLSAIAEHIKTTARERHLRWVITTHIENHSWHHKCQIAEALLVCWRDFLPSFVNEYSSCRLALQLTEILFTISSTEKATCNLIEKNRYSL